MRGFPFLWLGNKDYSRWSARPCGASVANAPLLLHSLTAARFEPYSSTKFESIACENKQGPENRALFILAGEQGFEP